jgi:Phosphotransferase enzyme family
MPDQAPSDQVLQEIQALQFRDIPAASDRMLDFLRSSDLPFNIASVLVRPLAVSLNSINGFITTDTGKKLFFKTHIEPQSIINEYYNAEILATANYPTIRPLFGSTEYGKQLLIYDYFDAPSLFDVLRAIELGERHDGPQIIDIQEQADRQLANIYLDTLAPLSAADHATAPIHQLFYHRLVGGRYENFYVGQDLALPGATVPFAELSQWRWRINGVEYHDSLQEIIDRAIRILNPHSREVWSIVGHGDAHNGNVFLDQNKLVYFDPAFAGRHSFLLDLTKPIFHNVFATWMYFPQAVADHLQIPWTVQNGLIEVVHDFVPIPERWSTLRSKLHFVLAPVLAQLGDRRPSHWREYLKAALFCCPFLTMNLQDSTKFPPAITLLGLSLAVEMGSAGAGILDRELDSLSRASDETSR